MKSAKEHIIVTFSTTADVFAFDKECKKNEIEGRIVSVPRQLSAGCGMAWKSNLENKQALLDLIDKFDLIVEDVHEINLDW